MAVFIKEDSAKLLKKEVPLNPKLTNLMIQKSNYYSKIDPTSQGAKRAKKITCAAEKEKYNTKDEKFTPSNSAVTLNANEIKRWKAALAHLPKNSNAFDANGGEEGKEMVDSLMKQIRQQNQQVPMIEPVDKLVKDIKVDDIDLKPTKIGKSDVYIESKRNKKIYIQENKLNLLKEVYNQLTIPFDNKYHEVDGKNIPMKQDYEYFIDWLESIGHYGTLPQGKNTSIREIINSYLKNPKYVEYLKDMFVDDYEDGGYIDGFIEDAYERLTDYEDYEGINCFLKEINDISELAYNEDLEEFTQYLTQDGLELCNKLLKQYILEKLDEYGFMHSIEKNVKNGLLYIERVITIPSITGYSNNFSEEDFFKHLNNSYDAVGECWTWKEGGGDAYNGNQGDKITFKGWVNINEVDWKETIFLNCYSLNYEKEIRLNKNSMVQINEITTSNNEHFPLKQSIIVPAHTGSYWNSDNIAENKQITLKEEENEENTPQNLLRVLLQIGKYGSLKPSKMTNEQILEKINSELENNEELMNFKEHINDYDFVDTVTSQNGRIYIERAITINSVYNLLSYDGLGTSWSWAKNGAEAYFGQGNIQLIFRGHVNAERVDWEQTTFLNVYPINMQKELRVEIGRTIEINGFFFNGKNYLLKRPILLNSGLSDIPIK